MIEATNRRRPGRPTLPPAQRRTFRIAYSCNREEEFLLHLRADAAGLVVSEMSRLLSLYGEIHAPEIPRVNLLAIAELNRLGKNLNQLLVALQRQLVPADFKPSLLQISLAVGELQKLIASVHRSLLAFEEQE